MLIDYNNYEQFFLMYIDQELTPEMCAAVEAFVLQHPELKEELEILKETVLLPDENIRFEQSANLLKHSQGIHEENVEAYIIQWQDGELDHKNENALLVWLSLHPEYYKLVAQFSKARLSEENHFAYPNKQELYRERTFFIRPFLSIAASILMLLTFGIWYSSSKKISTDQPIIVDNKQQLPIVPTNISPSISNAVLTKVHNTSVSEKGTVALRAMHLHKASMQKIIVVTEPEITRDLFTKIDEPTAKTTETTLSNHLPTPLPEHEMYRRAQSEEGNAVVLTEAQLPVADVPDEIEVFNTRLANKVTVRKIFRTLSRVVESTTGLRSANSGDTKVIQVANFEIAKH